MTIDERIVQLGLNNSNFEKNAAESLKTLDSLDKSLSSFGSAVGFDKLGDMIDTVTHRFSALGVAGDQVIRTITNQVTHLIGQMTNLAKSMSLDQISAGFSKYGEKTQSVQTIMAATAKDWDDQEAQMEWVSGQMEKLNWFTDETSYSFLDMANNIGKFTSNGIGLEESVTAMEGISTWAALSGANVGEASRAMYNLSQAMAVGSVKLMDWKSIENANMATREFKETALETAVSLGTLTKQADGTYKTLKGHTFTAEQFNTQLSDEWFSKDVLMATLNQYGSFSDALNKVTEELDMTASDILEAMDAFEKNKMDDFNRIARDSGVSAAELTEKIKELSKEEYNLGRKAFKAAQEAKTFKDAIDATKDAVSTGWMNLWEKVFGNYLETKDFWTKVANSFYDIFAEPINTLNEIFDIGFGGNLPDNINTVSKRTDILASALSDAGKTSEDLEKAMSKVDDLRLEALIAEYGSLEEAINRGAIKGELLKKILSELGIGEEVANEVEQATISADSFETRLTKAGHSMEDFEKAFSAVDDLRLESLISEYGSLEEAIKQGAVGADLFKRVLQEMAGQSSGTAEAVGTDISKLAGSLEEYRNVAMGVLRGDYGNGEERRKELEALGYDYEMIQWMAGNLQAYGYNISDEFLLSLDKTDAVREAFENLMISAGYTQEEIDAMNALLADSDQVLDDIKNGVGEVDRSAEKFDLQNGAELFRESIMNILHAVEDFTSAIGDAFNIVFGGSEDGKQAVLSFGARLNDLIVKFNEFTKSLKMNDQQYERFRNTIVGVLRAVKLVTSSISKVTKLTFRLAGGALKIAFGIISNITEKINELYDRLNKNGTLRNFAQGFKNAFEGIQTLAGKVFERVQLLFNLFKVNTGLGNFSLLQKIADWITILGVKFNWATNKFKKFIASPEGSEKITAVFLVIMKVVKFVIDVVMNLKDIFITVFQVISGVVSNVVEKITNFKNSIKGAEGSVSVFTRIGNAIRTAFEWIKNAFQTVKEAVQGFLGGENGVGVTKILTNLLGAFLAFKAVKGVAGIFGKIGEAIGGIGSIGEFIQNPLSIFSNLIDGFKEMFGFTEKQGSFVQDIRSIAISIGILALALLLLSTVNQDNLASSMGHLTTLLVEMVGALAVINNYIGVGNGVSKAAKAMIIMAGALLLLSLSLKIISTIDPNKMMMAWATLTMTLLTMVAAIYAVNEIDIKSGKLLAAGAAMIGIAIAMLILTASLAILSLIDPKKLAKAWIVMTLSLASMVAALYILTGVSDKINTAKLLAAGVAILLVAAAMLIMSAAMWVFSKIDAQKAIMPMVVTLMALSLALALLGKYANPVGMLAAGAAMVMVAAALVLVALAMAAIGFVVSKNEDSLIAFIAVLAVMTVALIALGALGPVILAAGAALLLAGIGFIALAAGMLIMGLAFKSMEGLHIGKIAGQLLLLVIPLALLGVAGIVFGLGGIGLIIGGIGLVALGLGLRAMEGISISPDWLLGLSFALMALGIGGLIFGLGGLGLLIGGVGLIALGYGLKAMMGIDIQPDWLLGLSGALLALGIAGIIFGLGAIGLTAGAPALSALADVLPPLASGLQAFAAVEWQAIGKAFVILTEAIAALLLLEFAAILNGVPVLEELAAAMPNVAAGFQSFESVNAEAIALASEGLSKAILALFELEFATFADGVPVLEELAAAMPNVAAGFQAFETVNGEAIALASEGLAKAIDALFTLQFTTFANGVPVLVELAAAMPGLSEGFKSFETMNGEAIATAGEGLGKAINALFLLQFTNFRDGGAELLGQLSETLPNLASGFEAFNSLTPEAIESTGTALKRAVDTLFKLEFATIRDGTPQLIALGEALPNIAAGFNAFEGTDPDWLKNVAKSLDSALSALANDNGFFSKKQDYSGLVDLGNALQVFWEGLKNFIGEGTIESPVSSLKTLVDAMKNEITNSLPSFELKGSSIIVSIVTGINRVINNYDNNWKTIGGNISTGIANGINEKLYLVKEAATGIANTVSDAVSETLDIRSPSRVMEKMGEYIDQGLGNGIAGESDYIENAMITAITPTMAVLNALLENDDLTISPTITPVVDMTNVNAASGSMSSLFGGSYSSYVNGVNSRMANVEASRAATTAAGSSSDIDYSTDLNAITAKLDELGTSISNMKLYLDSGALVGGIANQINTTLGTISIRESRGN